MSALRALPARRIVAAIADAAARWTDADFPLRVRAQAAVEARTGYPTPAVDWALDRLFGGFTVEALTATIAGELGGLAALDGPAATEGRPASWARGVERVVVVASDTTVGVAIPALVWALCAKCDEIVVKDRADLLVAAFLATLAEEEPAIAAAARAAVWRGGEDPDEPALLGAADVVVAYGGDEALRAIRARCAPEATFVPYGHRVSVGWLGADDRLDATAAEGLVRDALLFDGEGCLSLHALYAARGAALQANVAALAAALERVAVTFPAASVDEARTAARAGYRNAAAFRAAGGRGAVYRGGDGSATLVVEAPADEPPPLLPRVLPLVVVEDADALVSLARAQRLPIQALAVADPLAPAATALAAALDAVRVARFGALQDPPASGRHGGRPRIAPFVRWLDLA